MVRNRSRVLAKLADWSQLRTGTPDAVDQLRQQLQAVGIEVQDPRALRLIGRAIGLAEELHSEIGDEPEYMKRARLNYVLARLCSHLEAGMAEEMVRESLPPARGVKQADTEK
jgi:hypothetical protein